MYKTKLTKQQIMRNRIIALSLLIVVVYLLGIISGTMVSKVKATEKRVVTTEKMQMITNTTNYTSSSYFQFPKSKFDVGDKVRVIVVPDLVEYVVDVTEDNLGDISSIMYINPNYGINNLKEVRVRCQY